MPSHCLPIAPLRRGASVALLLLLAACATPADPDAPPREDPDSLRPTEAWLDGPPEPSAMLEITQTRLLVPLPEGMERGPITFTSLPGRMLYAQSLPGGAILYARYTGARSLPADPPAADLAEALYRDALAARTGIAPAAVTHGTEELPFGPTRVMTADGLARSCAAFFAPMRIGSKAPAETKDAYLRGAYCQTPGVADPLGPTPWEVLKDRLRKLVFRE